MIKKLQSRDRFLIYIVVLCLAFFLYYSKIHAPAAKKIRMDEKKIAPIQNKIKKLERALKNLGPQQEMLTKLEEKNGAIEAEIKRKMVRHPHGDTNNAMINLVTHQALPSHAAFAEVTVKRGEENDSLRQIQCKLKVQGSFEDLFTYVLNLEDLSPTVTIDWTSLKQHPEIPNLLVLDIEISCLFSKKDIAKDTALPSFDRNVVRAKSVFRTAPTTEVVEKKKSIKLPALKGILTTALGQKVAILDNETLGVGESGGDITVKQIETDKVVVVVEGVEATLALDKEKP